MAVMLPAALASCVAAQVVEVRGGNSTLYDAAGATVTMHARGFDASAGAGVEAGRIVGSAEWRKRLGTVVCTLGARNIKFNLPTDIFATDHYLTGIGGALQVQSGPTGLFLFGGETSTSFDTPFFDGVRVGRPAGIVVLSEKLMPQLTATIHAMVARQTTMIESLEWKANPSFRMAWAAGLGANRTYAASSLSIERPWLDLKAAYIYTDGQFRRIDSSTPLISEPTKENLVLTVRPTRNSSFTVARQNYLTPVAGSAANLASSVNQLGGSLDLRGVGLSATYFHSSFQGNSDSAFALTASKQFTRQLNVETSFLASRPEKGGVTNSLMTNVEEQLTPRWNLSQRLNYSNGRETVGWGGAFLSNWLTLSAEYQNYYVVQRASAPFQQSLVTDAKLHLLGRIAIGGSTFVAPDGRLLFTTEVEGELDREQREAQAAQPVSVGAVILRGKVIDRLGKPIMGAALWIDQSPVYTDSEGYFYVRERKVRTHTLQVRVLDFLDGGIYRVVWAPKTLRSSNDENLEEALIVVEATTPGAE